MAAVVPQISVTDSQIKEAPGVERQETASTREKGETGPLSNGKITNKLRSNPASSNTQSNEPPTQNGNTPDRGSEPPIDPLSQQILQRTSTPSVIPKLRTPTDNTSQLSPNSANDGAQDAKQATETAREVNTGTNKADKKKGVSFLSRFIGGNKRRSTLDDDENDSEFGGSRPEGMDAQLFMNTVDNMGFSPKVAQPPPYIKVRAKYKKEREFDRVFLAQELRASTKDGSQKPANSPLSSGAAAVQNPIWATEFSKDGKYLAAGGQDKIVRVWAVISSIEERRSHENGEAGPNAPSGEETHLSTPVFQQKVFKEFQGHEATILDLSWSKNNFLLSSSMDKTVRLWHVTRSECLCTFKHSDFVPSIQFHPRDDRFFLAGSLDTKLRLWSIPDKSVAYWNQLPDMITAVSFTPDGKTCIAGTLSGLCMFYETEGLKYQTQIHVKSTRGQNAKGSKITGIQATNFPPGNPSGEVKLLISSNDSRVRLYNLRDKSLEVKFRGHENNSSQIRASFADDTGYVICGSEDRKAYIFSTGPAETDKRNQKPMEMFDAHNSITTCAVFAPLKTRQLLSNSEDPIYDLCKPPPVTLVSKADSVRSSRAPTEAGTPQQTPAPSESHFRRVAESPAYLARSAHADGNIIVTADYQGTIKVFRQDCAYQKRVRASDWDTSSVFSKKLGRPSSILTRGSGRTRRDSTSTQPPQERIMSWRQDISHGSFDSVNGLPHRKHGRSTSPRKSVGQLSIASSRIHDSPALGPTPGASPSVRTTSPKTSLSMDRTPATTSTASNTPPRKQSNPGKPKLKETPEDGSNSNNPMSIYGGQSWAFWNVAAKKANLMKKGQVAPSSSESSRPELEPTNSTATVVSKLSSEENMAG